MVGLALFVVGGEWHGLVGRWEDGGGEGKGGCGGGGGVFLEPTWEECSSWVIGQGVCVNDRFSIFVCLDGWSSCQVLVPQSRFPPSKTQLKPSFPLIPTLFSPASSSIFDPSLMLHPYRPPSAPSPPPHLHRSLIHHTQPHTLNEESSPRS